MNIKAIIGFLAVIVAIALVILYLPASIGGNHQPQQKDFVLEIRNKKLAGDQKLTVHQGDSVIFSIFSDEAEEFHLHGYDRSVDIAPGKSATLSFTANASGRFVFELENSKTELGALEVLP